MFSLIPGYEFVFVFIILLINYMNTRIISDHGILNLNFNANKLPINT